MVRAGRAACLLSILVGAAMLSWPALVNGYPLVFSDSAALTMMGLEPNMGWDKPWVYGPLTALLHWGRSLWGVVAGQVILTSAMLWLVAHVAGVVGPLRHLGLCALLALGSAVPWFACFVMPDILAPIAVLSLFVLGWAALSRGAIGGLVVLASIAIASHLAHLVLAAGCLVPVLLLRPRRLLLCAAPLVAALAWLMGSNLVGSGVLAVSPYGSVFALARLQADGPATDYLREVCPAAGYRLCAWADQLPMDSDAFLWAPTGPMWANEYGPTLLAPEAARIVAATLRGMPMAVALHAVTNTLHQLADVAVGDTLGPQHLAITVQPMLERYFPAAEMQRFLAGRQIAGTLDAVVAPLRPLHAVLLWLGAIGTGLLLPLAWRRRPALAGLCAMVLVSVLANAFATGALSGPHDRYGARIAWLLLLPPALAGLTGLWRRRPAELLRSSL